MPYLHVFHPIWVLGPGGGGGLPRDTTCLCSFINLGSSKIEVFFTIFGYQVAGGGGGGVPKGLVHNTPMQFVTLGKC